MNKYVPEILLWLFVINLGIAYGAGLYEKRIILPQWFSKSAESGLRVNSEAMRQTNTGLRFWAYVTTVPLGLHCFLGQLVKDSLGLVGIQNWLGFGSQDWSGV